MDFQEGMVVKALKTITEGGVEEDADYGVKEIEDPKFVHGPKGCIGVVEHVTEDGVPTVRFEFRDTATVVDEGEVEFIGNYVPPKLPEGAKVIVWSSWETVLGFGTDDAEYLGDGDAICLGAFNTTEEAADFIMTLGSDEHLIEGCPGV